MTNISITWKEFRKEILYSYFTTLRTTLSKRWRIAYGNNFFHCT